MMKKLVISLFVLSLGQLLGASNCHWTGYILTTPETGIVQAGQTIDMEIVDFFEITDLPDNEYVVSVGEPVFDWYVNHASAPCKTGRYVTFTTESTNDVANTADIPAGDYHIAVAAFREYSIGWDDHVEEGESCGCGDPTCGGGELE